MKLIADHRVDMETAKARALTVLSHKTPNPASHIAGFIWPDHSMKPQGAGAAASRILKSLERDGKARWVHRGNHWGWVRA